MLSSRPFITCIMVAAVTLVNGCSEEQVLTRSALDNGNALPEPLSVVQQLSAAESGCAAQGIQVIHGLDHNHDGMLSPYERSNASLVCLPDGSGDGPAVARLPAAKAPANANDG